MKNVNKRKLESTCFNAHISLWMKISIPAILKKMVFASTNRLNWNGTDESHRSTVFHDKTPQICQPAPVITAVARNGMFAVLYDAVLTNNNQILTIPITNTIKVVIKL